MNVLKQNKVNIHQYDLERKYFQANLLKQEEKLQAMVNKTEQLKNENHTNLTTVSKLNDTVEILEVENHELKMKINEGTIHSVEAEELLQIKRQSDEMI